MNSIHRAVVLISAVVWLWACDTLPTHKPLAPEVTVESVDIDKLGFKDLVLAVRLNVFNPNRYAIKIDKVSFAASHAKQALLEGSSTRAFTLPSAQQQIIEVSINTRLDKAITELLRATSNEQSSLNLDIKGAVKFQNWPAPVPFTSEKALKNPLLSR